MDRYPQLRDETEHVLTGFLRNQEQVAKDHIKLMIDIELAYMNTNHPDFIGFQKYNIVYSTEFWWGKSLANCKTNVIKCYQYFLPSQIPDSLK